MLEIMFVREQMLDRKSRANRVEAQGHFLKSSKVHVMLVL